MVTRFCPSENVLSPNMGIFREKSLPIDDYAKDGGPGVPSLICGFYREPLRSLIVKKFNNFAI